GARPTRAPYTTLFRSEQGVQALLAAVRSTLGGLDVLVNNAGTMLGRVPAEEVTPEHYGRVLDLNARSVVLLSAGAIPLLRESDRSEEHTSELQSRENL